MILPVFGHRDHIHVVQSKTWHMLLLVENVQMNKIVKSVFSFNFLPGTFLDFLVSTRYLVDLSSVNSQPKSSSQLKVMTYAYFRFAAHSLTKIRFKLPSYCILDMKAMLYSEFVAFYDWVEKSF